MCADFCSDIKSLRSFLGVACDKKSVRVRWLQSEKKSEWRHPTMGPRLLLSHTIAPIKKSVRVRWLLVREKIGPIFSRSCLIATKNRSCALTRSEKKSDLRSDFFSELLTTKDRSVCAGHNVARRWWVRNEGYLGPQNTDEGVFIFIPY